MTPPPPLPRIAYLTGRYPEVSQTFILREVDALRALGADVLTCSIRRTPPEQHPGAGEKKAASSTFHVLEALRNPVRFIGAQLVYLRAPRRYFGALRLAWQTRPVGLRGLLYQLIYFFEATVLARYLETQKIDHLHNHFIVGSATVSMLVSRLTGIPFSFTLHGPADLFEPRRWALDVKTERARFVSTISHFARSQIMYFSAPEHWHKIHIIHCGVQPALYDSPQEAELPPRRKDEIRLLFVGRIAPVKGLRILLEAMQTLMPDVPNLHLVLVGDGPDRSFLEELAAPLGDAVSFTGYLSQNDVVHAMQTADIYVLPSFAEGVPVALMEAFASGKPVIATQVAGVSELVEDGKSGFLVPPGDVDSLVARIHQLSTDPARRAQMGQRGQAKVRAEFDIDVEAARLLHLFTGQADGSLRPGPWVRPPT